MRDLKHILELHPLYRRLSGQVIWLMFEERGAPEAHIGAFLESYEAEKLRNLELMGMALDGSKFSHLLLTMAREAPACERCLKVSGRAVEIGRPDLAAWFPPYGLGCALRPELISANEYERSGAPALIDPKAKPPRPRLLCGEWIFEYPWAESPG